MSALMHGRCIGTATRTDSSRPEYGETILRKPQFQEFPFETQVFGRNARVEKALVDAIVESYLQGVSTKRIQEFVGHLGIDHLSPASVSRMAKDFDDQVQAFLLRQIEQIIPYLYTDASYCKVRNGARYVAKAVLVDSGVREDGCYQEILGARVTYCENEGFWSGLFDKIKERGVNGVQLIISDGLTGIQKAASAAFLGASWQMCSVHCARAVLRNIPRKHLKKVAESLKEAYGSEQGLQGTAEDLNIREYQKAANTIERFLLGLMSYTTFPKEHWKRIRTTNVMERVNKELKRRSATRSCIEDCGLIRHLLRLRCTYRGMRPRQRGV